VGQPVQIAGALLMLAAFALSQFRVLRPESPAYLWANLIGSAVLAVDAWLGSLWGFFLLEGVWAVVSAWGLLRPALARRGKS
jgi:hypothetical protein